MDVYLVKIEICVEGGKIGFLIKELNFSKVYWIGLRVIEVENYWKWFDGSLLGLYRFWVGKKMLVNFIFLDCVGLYGILWYFINCLWK